MYLCISEKTIISSIFYPYFYLLFINYTFNLSNSIYRKFVIYIYLFIRLAQKGRRFTLQVQHFSSDIKTELHTFVFSVKQSNS